MKLKIKMAWRNVWRNRRRTLITTSSIFMAVLLSIVMGSMQKGSYEQMIQNSVGSFVGHAQIQHDLFIDEPSLDNGFILTPDLISSVENVRGVKAVIPRIDSYALAADGDRSRATMVIGVDPVRESFLSDPESRLISGSYFKNGDDGVLVSEGLATYLNIAVADSIILLGQGYRGMSANGIFPVTGIIKFGIPELNRGIIYLPLHQAQSLYGADGLVTSIAIISENPSHVGALKNEIGPLLSDELVVHDWKTLMPEIVQAIEVDYVSSFFILAILYMVVGFGILGTVLMMTSERKYEFGVMISIGTPRRMVASIFVLEMFVIAILGVVTGSLIAVPIVLWFNYNPIYFTGDTAQTLLEFGMEPFLRFSTDPGLFYLHAGIVFGMTLLISLYPVIHLKRLEPVMAMRR